MRDDLASLVSQTKWKEHEFRAAAHYLGYDPNKLLFFNNINDTPEIHKDIQHAEEARKHADLSKTPGACTNVVTGEITVYYEGVPEGYERGMLIHEIYHVYFERFLRKLSEMKDGKIPPDVPFMLRAIAGFGNKEQLTNDYKPRCLTDYADCYYAAYREGKMDFLSFCTETLSEMARVQEMTGEVVGSKQWKALFQLVTEVGRDGNSA